MCKQNVGYRMIAAINLLFVCVLFFSNNYTAIAQNVAITDNDSYTAESSAMLDVMSTNKGMLVPRLTSTQRIGIVGPAQGLMVYDTDLKSFMYYNGSTWITIPQLASSAASGEALFAVVNHLGDTVFAVYHDGVRIFVDPEAKGKVGGFAISGRTPTKAGEKVEYFRVTPDSTRIYVNDSIGTKGKVGGFAISGRTPTKENGVKEYFTINKDSTRIYIDSTANKDKVGGFAISGRTPTKAGYTPEDYFNISTSSNADVIPDDARIAWYPKKEAFLAGRVQVLNPDSVGLNAFVTGYHSMAKGDYSQAFGYQTIARGDYSTAIGKNAVAGKINSFAFGENANSLGDGSYSFGTSANSVGKGSFAFGSVGRDTLGVLIGNPTIASGEASFSFGLGSISSGLGSFSLGINNNSSNLYSFAIGYQNTSSGEYSFSMGRMNQATGEGSIAIGRESISTDYYSIAIGQLAESRHRGTIAIGEVAKAIYGIAIGNQAYSSGGAAIAFGQQSNATNDFAISIGSGSSSGIGSTSIGFMNFATGAFSSAIGSYTYAQSHSSFVIGRYNVISGDQNNWVNTDPLFVIGNGSSSSSRSNALTILKNGNVGIGTTSPSTPLQVNSSGDIPYLLLNTTSTTNKRVRLQFGQANVINWELATDASSNNTDDLYFFNRLTSTFGPVIKNNGNVGIGTTTPGAYKLYVNGGDVLINRGDGLYGFLKLTGHSYVGSADWGHLYLFSGSNSGNASIIFMTEGTEKAYITGNGNMGIGGWPDAKLKVDGGGFAIGVADAINDTYGSQRTIQLTTQNGINGGSYDNHTGALIWTTLESGGWGDGRLKIALGTNWSTYNTSSPALIIGQNFLDAANLGFRTGNTERMIIKSTGKIGMGTTSPSYKIDVYDNSSDIYAARVFKDGNSVLSNGLMIQAGFDALSGLAVNMIGFFDGDGTYEGAISLLNGTLSLVQNSDERLKKNISNSSINAIDVLSKIRVVDYNFKDDKNNFKHTGYIAQELLNIKPDMVIYNQQEDIYGVDYVKLVPILNLAIQQQQNQIQSLEQRNSELENKVELYESKINEIENLKSELEAIKAELSRQK